MQIADCLYAVRSFRMIPGEGGQKEEGKAGGSCFSDIFRTMRRLSESLSSEPILHFGFLVDSI